MKVLYRLKKESFEAYLVGGGVRDMLLGAQPKDFDVATDALPDEVRGIFSNCRLIGRRFRLAHIHFGREIIEVATFRGSHDTQEGDVDAQLDETGRILRDNVYGSIEEDVLRRDFTVNALYYNIRDFAIYDYVGGMGDLERKVLRLIGDPHTRYREDPVRMLRAVRFAAKLDFTIDEHTEQGIFDLAASLRDISSARLFDECLKLLMSGQAVATFRLLRHYGLFAHLFPGTEAILQSEGADGPTMTLLNRAFQNTDERIAQGKPVTPAFLFAALLWGPVRDAATAGVEQGLPVAVALQQAAASVVDAQLKHVSLPKRFRAPMFEIWHLQSRFERRHGKRVWQLMAKPRFRAAYDFLLLRAEAGEVEGELAEWWTRFQDADRDEQDRMLAASNGGSKPRKRRRRRRPTRSVSPAADE